MKDKRSTAFIHGPAPQKMEYDCIFKFEANAKVSYPIPMSKDSKVSPLLS